MKISHPFTAKFLAGMVSGQFKPINSTETLVISKDGLSAYSLSLNDYAGPYLHTDATEAARVEKLIRANQNYSSGRWE